MNKIITLSLTFLLAACAANQGGYQVRPLYSERNDLVLTYANPAPSQTCQNCQCQEQGNPCQNCQYVPDACREVLRPRITQITIKETCRSCPVDNQAVICGNTTCHTFKEKETVLETAQFTVPAMPEAYRLASKRAYERMEKANMGWCTQKPTIFVQSAQVLSADLPAGTDSGVAEMKKQISESSAFTLSSDASKADYTLETTVDWFDTPTKQVPAIQYRVVVYDKKHNRVDEWVEIVKFADNQSWI